MSGDEHDAEEGPRAPTDAKQDIAAAPLSPYDPSAERGTVAEVVDVWPRKPRIWPALAVAILTLPAAFVVSTAVLVMAMLADLDLAAFRSAPALEAWLEDFTKSRIGFLVLVLPGQLVFLTAALAAAWLSPVPFKERLRLVPGKLPVWSWLILGLATPAIGLLSSEVMSLFFTDMGEHLEMLNNLFRSHRGAFTAVVLALVAFLPGVSEEALFRGYLQSRLLLRMGPMAAILVSSVLFAIAHLDPRHVLAVFPIGLWLGLIAWRSDSILPAIVCHIVNNAAAIIVTYFSDAEGFAFEPDAANLTLLAISGLSLFASVPILLKFGSARRHTSAAAAAAE